jgi:hypothetical protein
MLRKIYSLFGLMVMGAAMLRHVSIPEFRALSVKDLSLAMENGATA